MGGCVSSKWVPNVFHVWNVDEYGNLLMPGRIEVTEAELVLYQKSREPIRWPMRCLRRYGFDAELFSFESGRRCATGPGIYAFKCRQAETLFTLIQEHIQASCESDAASTQPSVNVTIHNSVSTTLSEPSNYLEPIQRHRTRSSASRDSFPTARLVTNSLPSCHMPNYGSEEGNVPTSPTTPPANGTLHNYENSVDEPVDRSVYALTDLPKGLKSGRRPMMLRGHSLDESGNYARLDDLFKQEHSAQRHLYMNVVPDAVTKQRSLDSPSPTSLTNNNNNISQLVRQVNYAVLDLNHQQRKQLQRQISFAETELRTVDEDVTERNVEGYATIDFDRTTALSSTANQPSDDADDSVRKTRHNTKNVAE